MERLQIGGSHFPLKFSWMSLLLLTVFRISWSVPEIKQLENLEENNLDLRYSNDRGDALKENISEAINYLAVNLHKVISKEKKNVLFSPISICVAINMIICGAEGETEKELREALGHQFADIKKEDLASVFKQIISNMLQQNRTYTLSLANIMLSQKNFKLKDCCKMIFSEFFKALHLEVDFKGNNEKIIYKINNWVEEKTNKKITNFVKSLHPNTVAVLLNAIYFKGSWMKKFDLKLTKSENFFNNGMEKTAKKVDMMHMMHSFPFYREKDHSGLMLPYIGEEVSMVFILPQEKNGLDSLEATLKPSFFKAFKNKFRKTKVSVGIPRFHLEYERQLIPTFQELGVKRVFRDAELSILRNERGLFVCEILHKAVLDVNEEGSEAAAATMVSLTRSLPPYFIADHPFIFVIYSMKNDLILFMGRVNEL